MRKVGVVSGFGVGGDESKCVENKTVPHSVELMRSVRLLGSSLLVYIYIYIYSYWFIAHTQVAKMIVFPTLGKA